MKKTLISLLAVAMLVPAGTVFADDIACGQQIATSSPEVRQCGNGNPEAVVNGFGVKNVDVPHVQPGVTIQDAAGIPFLCPSWFSNYCVNVSGTETYKVMARSLAKQLQAGSWSLGLYAYWLTH